MGIGKMKMSSTAESNSGRVQNVRCAEDTTQRHTCITLEAMTTALAAEQICEVSDGRNHESLESQR